MSDLKRRLHRLDGTSRSKGRGGVYVVRTKKQEREAQARAAALGDRWPVIVWRLTPLLDGDP
jgi:hypothetical protein